MIDLRKIARRYGVPFVEEGHPRAREGWVALQCPLCGAGGTHGGWYLGFSLTTGAFHCWRCGALKARDVLPGLLRIPPEAVGRVLAEHRTDRPPRAAPAPRKKNLRPPPGAGPLGDSHRRYLAGRGYCPEKLEEKWGLQGTGPLGGDWAWRVVAPVTTGGRVVAYQGRAIGNFKPKYKMTADADILTDPRGLLYGADEVPGDAVLIVEGVTGVWRFGPGAVATFGIDWKPQQLPALLRFKRRYILFDPEPLAQRRAIELAYELALLSGIDTVLLTGAATDPGDMRQGRADALAARINLR